MGLDVSKQATQNQRGEHQTREPIAIIGLGCRFPGEADNPKNFWKLICEGRDAISDIPPDRFDIERFYDADPKVPGRSYVKAAGFLKQRIDEFDAAFFGISPREAEHMDPQQRLLLEVAWEAFEDAGLAPARLAGSDTGVYIGGFMLDSLTQQLGALYRPAVGQYTGVGVMMTILSNRLSHVFDFRGPSLSVDTACSSSLVAFHQACQALWNGECSLALVGGVNVMHAPESFLMLCKAGLLAPDGRSKSFDARGDGYGRGEGAGVVVLKPLVAAQADGDRIYAVVRGTGVNQDGHTDGISVPSAEAQAALIRQVCAQAGVDPRHIHCVEAHGTGTAVGDPTECRALGETIGAGRDGTSACAIGSVKANIGHLEAAAGVAGLIKLALCLHHRQVPPVANLGTPNPAIPFDTLGLRLPRALEPLPEGEGPLLGAINSFGYGGTNAHAVLEAVAPTPVQDEPVAEPVPKPDGAFELLPLSARSPAALRALVTAHVGQLEAPDVPPLHARCAAAALRREHHAHRLGVAADSPAALRDRLRAWLESDTATGVAEGRATAPQSPVFVFTGMGPQWWAMGRELLAHEPVFRAEAEACDAAIQRQAGWSALAELARPQAESRVTSNEVAQPANFVIQAGLAALWRSWGVEPAAVVGHSVGEVAAAYVAGSLDLESAVRVALQRSGTQQQVAHQGGMLAAGVSAERAQALLCDHPGVSLAAVNSPESVTLAGDSEGLAKIAATLQAEGLFHKPLQVEVAYHSPFMDPLKPQLMAALHGLQPQSPRLALYSTVTGRQVTAPAHDAAYWCDNMREPVLFAQAMDGLIGEGHRLFLEVGPHPVLSAAIRQCLAARGVEGTTLPSLRRGEPERATMAGALAGLYAAGGAIDWNRLHPQGATALPLPLYPWQREVHWKEDEEAKQDRIGHADHPLLGLRQFLPTPAWRSSLSTTALPWLPDHRVEELCVLPGAAYVELALAVHQALGKSGPAVLEDLVFGQALVIEPHRAPVLMTGCDEASGEFTIHSQLDDKRWTLHASGRMVEADAAAIEPSLPTLQILQARLTDATEALAHQQEMSRRGFQYGSTFQGIRTIWRGARWGEALARIEFPQVLQQDLKRYWLHPAMLDASFQVMLATINIHRDDGLYVPVRIGQLHCHRELRGALWCHARRRDDSEGHLHFDLALYDEDGAVVATFRDFQCQNLRPTRHSVDDLPQWLYGFDWQVEATPEPVKAKGRWLVFMDKQGTGEALAAALRVQGVLEIVQAWRSDGWWKDGAGHGLRPEKEHFERLLREIGPIDALVYCWALDASSELDPAGIEVIADAVALIQALAITSGPRLQIVTRGAEWVLPQQLGAPVSPPQVPLVGLLRAAANEHPELRPRLIDIDSAPDAIHQLVQELCNDSAEEEVAWRAGLRCVPRLVRRGAEELKPLESAPLIRSEASYLITGGFGGFGLELAHWLVAQGARHLVLASRSGDGTPQAQAAVRALERGGARVLAVAADVADAAQVQRLMADTKSRMPPLKGVFHTAVVLDGNASIIQSQREGIRNAMRAKAVGAWNLHQATCEMALDQFVLFSSMASVMGPTGIPAYAAANLFLDQLAQWRRSRGLPAVSINWGSLGDVGMVGQSSERTQHLNLIGMPSLTPGQAMQALAAILRSGIAQIGVSLFQWRRWLDFHSALTTSPRFRGPVEEVAQQREIGTSSSSDDLWAGLDDTARLQVISSALIEAAAQVLKLDPQRIDAGHSLLQLGLDSLLAVELQAVLERRIGLRVPLLGLMGNNSLAQLAQQWSEQADVPGGDSIVEKPSGEPEDSLLVSLEDLGEDDIDRLLDRIGAQP